MCNSDKASSSMLINLRQYETYLKDLVSDDKRKIDEHLMKFKQEYIDCKNQNENRHPIYKKLRNAEVEFDKIDYEYKYDEAELNMLKEQLKFKRDIQRTIANTNIINFAKAVKEHKEMLHLRSQIAIIKNQEADLIRLYEKKLKEKSKLMYFLTRLLS